AASPQFNGNPAYANVVNKDGKHLFATSYDAEKWKRAAQAAKDVIDLGIFDLYKAYHKDGTIDPYLSCRNVFLENWNCEVMMVRIANSLSGWERSASPRQFSGYESMGATQQLVDAFRMADGSAITPQQETGFSTEAYKDAETGWVFAPAGTRNMYVNREPRFYVNICFNGAYWIGDQKTRIQLYYTGGSGKKGTWDYPRSGYIAIKNVSPSSNPKNNNYIKRPFLMMR
ncbi:protein containing RagB/SusD domain protein, partial [human gut metagenome]